jgi:hypothetical protein
MKPRFTLIPLLIALASIGAVITTRQYDATLPEAEPAHASAGQVHAHAYSDALADMTMHAVRRLGDVRLQPERLGDDPHWTPEYRLQWVRAETADGRAFVIYLATYTQLPEFRFVAIAEVDGDIEEWELIHQPTNF